MTGQSSKQLNRRTLVKVAGAGAAAIALPSLSAPTSSAQETPQSGGTLRYGLNVEPRRMNQLNTTWMTDATQHVYGRLLTRDLEGNYIPELATLDVSEDTLTLTFTLREGITFHNGDPLTSDAAAWWFEKARDPDTLYGFKGSYAAVESIEAVDPLTVVVTLAQPDAALQFMLYTVYSSIHNPATYEELGDDGYGIQGADGTGPFKLQEFTPGGALIIVRNDAYAWPSSVVQNAGSPYLDAIEYRFIADASARSAAIEAGDLDIVVAPNLADVERLQQNDNLTVISKPQPACRTINFNCERAPLSDKRVRQALAHAIDRQPIVDRLLFGQGIVATSIVPPIFPDIFLEDTAGYFPYDLDAARALLADAGLTDENGDGVVEFEGEALRLEMLTSTDSDVVQLATVFQAQAAEVGIAVEITQLDVETLSSRIREGTFDVISGGYLWDGPDTMYDWWFFSANIGATNATRLADADVDGLIEEMRRTGTLADRYAVTRALQEKIHGDLVPVIPVFHPLDIYVIGNRVRGYEPNPYTLYPRMNDVWLA